MTDVSMLKQINETQKNELNQRESWRREGSWTMKEMLNQTNAV
jgi:mannosyltransferase OCH1-like enzyme